MIGKIQDALGAAPVVQSTDFAAVKSGTLAPAAPADSALRSSNPAPKTDALTESQRQIAESPAAIFDGRTDAQLKMQEISAIAKAKAEAQEEARKEKLSKEKTVDESQMTYLMKEINRIMNRMNCNLAFEYHQEVDVMSVRMVDKKTGKLIKEMPPEDMIKGMEKTREWIGTFLDRPI